MLVNGLLYVYRWLRLPIWTSVWRIMEQIELHSWLRHEWFTTPFGIVCRVCTMSDFLILTIVEKFFFSLLFLLSWRRFLIPWVFICAGLVFIKMNLQTSVNVLPIQNAFFILIWITSSLWHLTKVLILINVIWCSF